MSATTNYIETVNFSRSHQGLILGSLENVVNGFQAVLAQARWNPLQDIGDVNFEH